MGKEVMMPELSGHDGLRALARSGTERITAATAALRKAAARLLAAGGTNDADRHTR